MKPVLVFDVNETLLDLSALDPEFERLFGDAGARREWFAQVVRSALTLAAIGRYRDFSSVGAAALSMLAERRGTPLDSDAAPGIGAAMRRLPAYPDVADALAELETAGFRLVALTNSPEAAMREQLASSGLDRYLREAISVEAAGALKPARAVYTTAAGILGAATGEMLMIAAHGWDLAGAMAAGCRTAFVERPGQVPEATVEAPDIRGRDMQALAQEIVRRFG